MSDPRLLRRPRWYFGGLASACAACVSHPLDLLKVVMQTHQQKLTMLAAAKLVYAESGLFGYYNGISASLVRQLTYSSTRFGLYETGKDFINTDGLGGKLFLACFAGTIGGFCGVPADVVNVRMQNDVKLPLAQRRNYRHVGHGFAMICQTEGFKTLFSGATMATVRGGMMTIGQIVSYEETKRFLLTIKYFKDDFVTHILSSLGAATMALMLTQPLDVLKTRGMNAKKGEFNSILDIVRYTAAAGPTAFYKGSIPSFLRVAPHTIILFLIFERFRIIFGIDPPPKNPDK